MAVIKVDENDPIGELEPSFPARDVKILHNVDMREFYDLREEIGRGKFGTVYRCQEKKTGIILAAKFVSISKKQDRRNVEREVEIMKTLQHPRLIQLYDSFEMKNVMCVVLELIEGGELFERVIDDDFILTEKSCTVFMRQICEGVQFIHANNVIHLDLKPENILCLTKTGNRIKIIDFGLARRYEPNKKLQVLFGTPEFVAPEVVNFEEITTATDMWSVGVICYVLLSGLSPFMGETDLQTMSNVTTAQYDFDDEAFDNISKEAKDFISNLLVKSKESRMTSSQCLSHPWLRRRQPPYPLSLDTSKENLKYYVENNFSLSNPLLLVSNDKSDAQLDSEILDSLRINAYAEVNRVNNLIEENSDILNINPKLNENTDYFNETEVYKDLTGNKKLLMNNDFLNGVSDNEKVDNKHLECGELNINVNKNEICKDLPKTIMNKFIEPITMGEVNSASVETISSNDNTVNTIDNAKYNINPLRGEMKDSYNANDSTLTPLKFTQVENNILSEESQASSISEGMPLPTIKSNHVHGNSKHKQVRRESTDGACKIFVDQIEIDKNTICIENNKDKLIINNSILPLKVESNNLLSDNSSPHIDGNEIIKSETEIQTRYTDINKINPDEKTNIQELNVQLQTNKLSNNNISQINQGIMQSDAVNITDNTKVSLHREVNTINPHNKNNIKITSTKKQGHVIENNSNSSAKHEIRTELQTNSDINNSTKETVQDILKNDVINALQNEALVHSQENGAISNDKNANINPSIKKSGSANKNNFITPAKDQVNIKTQPNLQSIYNTKVVTHGVLPSNSMNNISSTNETTLDQDMKSAIRSNKNSIKIPSTKKQSHGNKNESNCSEKCEIKIELQINNNYSPKEINQDTLKSDLINVNENKALLDKQESGAILNTKNDNIIPSIKKNSSTNKNNFITSAKDQGNIKTQQNSQCVNNTKEITQKILHSNSMNNTSSSNDTPLLQNMNSGNQSNKNSIKMPSIKKQAHEIINDSKKHEIKTELQINNNNNTKETDQSILKSDLNNVNQNEIVLNFEENGSILNNKNDNIISSIKKNGSTNQNKFTTPVKDQVIIKSQSNPQNINNPKEITQGILHSNSMNNTSSTNESHQNMNSANQSNKNSMEMSFSKKQGYAIANNSNCSEKYEIKTELQISNNNSSKENDQDTLESNLINVVNQNKTLLNDDANRPNVNDESDIISPSFKKYGNANKNDSISPVKHQVHTKSQSNPQKINNPKEITQGILHTNFMNNTSSKNETLSQQDINANNHNYKNNTTMPFIKKQGHVIANDSVSSSKNEINIESQIDKQRRNTKEPSPETLRTIAINNVSNQNEILQNEVSITIPTFNIDSSKKKGQQKKSDLNIAKFEIQTNRQDNNTMMKTNPSGLSTNSINENASNKSETVFLEEVNSTLQSSNKNDKTPSKEQAIKNDSNLSTNFEINTEPQTNRLTNKIKEHIHEPLRNNSKHNMSHSEKFLLNKSKFSGPTKSNVKMDSIKKQGYSSTTDLTSTPKLKIHTEIERSRCNIENTKESIQETLQTESVNIKQNETMLSHEANNVIQNSKNDIKISVKKKQGHSNKRSSNSGTKCEEKSDEKPSKVKTFPNSVCQVSALKTDASQDSLNSVIKLNTVQNEKDANNFYFMTKTAEKCETILNSEKREDNKNVPEPFQIHNNNQITSVKLDENENLKSKYKENKTNLPKEDISVQDNISHNIQSKIVPLNTVTSEVTSNTKNKTIFAKKSDNDYSVNSFINKVTKNESKSENIVSEMKTNKNNVPGKLPTEKEKYKNSCSNNVLEAGQNEKINKSMNHVDEGCMHGTNQLSMSNSTEDNMQGITNSINVGLGRKIYEHACKHDEKSNGINGDEKISTSLSKRATENALSTLTLDDTCNVLRDFNKTDINDMKCPEKVTNYDFLTMTKNKSLFENHFVSPVNRNECLVNDNVTPEALYNKSDIYKNAHLFKADIVSGSTEMNEKINSQCSELNSTTTESGTSENISLRDSTFDSDDVKIAYKESRNTNSSQQRDIFSSNICQNNVLTVNDININNVHNTFSPNTVNYDQKEIIKQSLNTELQPHTGIHNVSKSYQNEINYPHILNDNDKLSTNTFPLRTYICDNINETSSNVITDSTKVHSVYTDTERKGSVCGSLNNKLVSSTVKEKPTICQNTVANRNDASSLFSPNESSEQNSFYRSRFFTNERNVTSINSLQRQSLPRELYSVNKEFEYEHKTNLQRPIEHIRKLGIVNEYGKNSATLPSDYMREKSKDTSNQYQFKYLSSDKHTSITDKSISSHSSNHKPSRFNTSDNNNSMSLSKSPAAKEEHESVYSNNRVHMNNSLENATFLQNSRFHPRSQQTKSCTLDKIKSTSEAVKESIHALQTFKTNSESTGKRSSTERSSYDGSKLKSSADGNSSHSSFSTKESSRQNTLTRNSDNTYENVKDKPFNKFDFERKYAEFKDRTSDKMFWKKFETQRQLDETRSPHEIFNKLDKSLNKINQTSVKDTPTIASCKTNKAHSSGSTSQEENQVSVRRQKFKISEQHRDVPYAYASKYGTLKSDFLQSTSLSNKLTTNSIIPSQSLVPSGKEAKDKLSLPEKVPSSQQKSM